MPTEMVLQRDRVTHAVGLGAGVELRNCICVKSPLEVQRVEAPSRDPTIFQNRLATHDPGCDGRPGGREDEIRPPQASPAEVVNTDRREQIEFVEEMGGDFLEDRLT